MWTYKLLDTLKQRNPFERAAALIDLPVAPSELQWRSDSMGKNGTAEFFPYVNRGPVVRRLRLAFDRYDFSFTVEETKAGGKPAFSVEGQLTGYVWNNGEMVPVIDVHEVGDGIARQDKRMNAVLVAKKAAVTDVLKRLWVSAGGAGIFDYPRLTVRATGSQYNPKPTDEGWGYIANRALEAYKQAVKEYCARWDVPESVFSTVSENIRTDALDDAIVDGPELEEPVMPEPPAPEPTAPEPPTSKPAAPASKFDDLLMDWSALDLTDKSAFFNTLGKTVNKLKGRDKERQSQVIEIAHKVTGGEMSIVDAAGAVVEILQQ